MRSSFFRRCLRYLIPPHCGGCGTVLDPSDSGELCPSCLEKWERIIREECPCCHKPAESCTCQAPAFVGLKDVSHLSLLFYSHYHADRLSDQMLYQAKRKENAHSLSCFAAFLAEKLSAYAEEHSLSLSGYVILYPPRSEGNLRKYGFDHAARIAKEIAGYCGIKCRSAFRREGGKEQKLADAAARHTNAEETLFLKSSKAIKDAEGIILFDDVVTTGATAARCIHLIREVSMAPVLVLSIAKTAPQAAEPCESKLPSADEPLWFE